MEFPASLACGIIVGYAVALLLVVTCVAIKRKKCCSSSSGGGGHVSLAFLESGSGAKRTGSAAEFVPLVTPRNAVLASNDKEGKNCDAIVTPLCSKATAVVIVADTAAHPVPAVPEELKENSTGATAKPEEVATLKVKSGVDSASAEPEINSASAEPEINSVSAEPEVNSASAEPDVIAKAGVKASAKAETKPDVETTVYAQHNQKTRLEKVPEAMVDAKPDVIAGKNHESPELEPTSREEGDTDDSRRLRRITDQLDAILDEFSGFGAAVSSGDVVSDGNGDAVKAVIDDLIDRVVGSDLSPIAPQDEECPDVEAVANVVPDYEMAAREALDRILADVEDEVEAQLVQFAQLFVADLIKQAVAIAAASLEAETEQ